MCMMSLAIQLNYEQNIKTSSKILSIIGQKKKLPDRKIGENISKTNLFLPTPEEH